MDNRIFPEFTHRYTLFYHVSSTLYKLNQQKWIGFYQKMYHSVNIVEKSNIFCRFYNYFDAMKWRSKWKVLQMSPLWGSRDWRSRFSIDITSLRDSRVCVYRGVSNLSDMLFCFIGMSMYFYTLKFSIDIMSFRDSRGCLYRGVSIFIRYAFLLHWNVNVFLYPEVFYRHNVLPDSRGCLYRGVSIFIRYAFLLHWNVNVFLYPEVFYRHNVLPGLKSLCV